MGVKEQEFIRLLHLDPDSIKERGGFWPRFRDEA